MPTVLKPDPFSAVLLDSPTLVVTDEQLRLIRRVLDTSSSDSKFADKAYAAILLILTKGITEAPVISSLNPASAPVGTLGVPLVITGTGFTITSEIRVAGLSVSSAFVSETELHTTIFLDSYSVPTSIPVVVISHGIASDPVMFEVVAA